MGTELLSAGKTAQDLLVEFRQTGRQEPFEEIVRRYAGMVFHVCYQVTKNTHDAEDATQAVFLTLAIQGKSEREIRCIGPWLQQVAYRLSLDMRKSKKRRQVREERHSMDNGEQRESDCSHALDSAELRHLMTEELNRLPAKYRMPLILHYFGGLSREEMAKELNCKPNTLGVRLFRGREMLGNRLAERGIGLAGGVLGVALAYAVQASVSEAMVASTCHAATQLAAGQQVSSGVVSAQVLGLARGAAGILAAAKMKTAVAVLLLAGSALATGVGVVNKVYPLNLSLKAPLDLRRLLHLRLAPLPRLSDATPAKAPVDSMSLATVGDASPSVVTTKLVTAGPGTVLPPVAVPPTGASNGAAAAIHVSGFAVGSMNFALGPVVPAKSSPIYAPGAELVTPPASGRESLSAFAAAAVQAAMVASPPRETDSAARSPKSSDLAMAEGSGVWAVPHVANNSGTLPVSAAAAGDNNVGKDLVLKPVAMATNVAGGGGSASGYGELRLAGGGGLSVSGGQTPVFGPVPMMSGFSASNIPLTGPMPSWTVDEHVLRGWGTVPISGTLDNSGQVIADGQGQDRTLDLSSAKAIRNSIPNPPGGKNGLFAIHHGKLVLASVPVTPGMGAVVWGDDSRPIDLVNSVEVSLPPVQKPGAVEIALLSPDRGDVPSLPPGQEVISLYALNAQDVTLNSMLLTVRYDDAQAAALGARAADLGLWGYNGRWQLLNGDVFTVDSAHNLISGRGESLSYFAVTAAGFSTATMDAFVKTTAGTGTATADVFTTAIVPEPAGLMVVAAAGLLLGRRRRRR